MIGERLTDDEIQEMINEVDGAELIDFNHTPRL
jgi:Ca2+-binding EF-hand superfamily protein